MASGIDLHWWDSFFFCISVESGVNWNPWETVEWTDWILATGIANNNAKTLKLISGMGIKKLDIK